MIKHYVNHFYVQFAEFTVFDGGIFGKEIASQKMNFSDVDRNTARDVHFQMVSTVSVLVCSVCCLYCSFLYFSASVSS